MDYSKHLLTWFEDFQIFAVFPDRVEVRILSSNFNHLYPHALFKIKRGESSDIKIKLVGMFFKRVAYITPAGTYERWEKITSLFQGGILATLFILFLINLIHGSIISDRATIYYVCYLTSLIFISLTADVSLTRLIGYGEYLDSSMAITWMAANIGGGFFLLFQEISLLEKDYLKINLISAYLFAFGVSVP